MACMGGKVLWLVLWLVLRLVLWLVLWLVLRINKRGEDKQFSTVHQVEITRESVKNILISSNTKRRVLLRASMSLGVWSWTLGGPRRKMSEQEDSPYQNRLRYSRERPIQSPLEKLKLCQKNDYMYTLFANQKMSLVSRTGWRDRPFSSLESKSNTVSRFPRVHAQNLEHLPSNISMRD